MARFETGNGSRYLGAMVRWGRGLALGTAVMAAMPAPWGGELNLLVNGWSRHISPPAGTNYNERHWGAGLQYDFDRVEEHWVPFLTASGFKDSLRNMSYYAGGGAVRRFDVAPALNNLHFDLGAVAFVMTRKNFKDNNPFLGALPVASIGTDHFAVNITYVPKVHPKLIPVWFFQLKVPLAKY